MKPLQSEFSRSSSSNNETENATPSLYTEDGTVDFRGNPAVRATTGGKKTTAILLGKSLFNSLLYSGTLYLSLIDYSITMRAILSLKFAYLFCLKLQCFVFM